MKLNRRISILLMCSWVLGMQVWYYGQFAAVLRALLNAAVTAK